MRSLFLAVSNICSLFLIFPAVRIDFFLWVKNRPCTYGSATGDNVRLQNHQ